MANNHKLCYEFSIFSLKICIFAKQINKKLMKFTLLVVGRTVEKHYITAIDDYVSRTKHFISFDMEVIPELKNTKNLSMEQQKEKEVLNFIRMIESKYSNSQSKK